MFCSSCITTIVIICTSVRSGSLQFLQKPVCSIPFSRQDLIQILDKITGSGRLLVKIASRCVHLSAFYSLKIRKQAVFLYQLIDRSGYPHPLPAHKNLPSAFSSWKVHFFLHPYNFRVNRYRLQVRSSQRHSRLACAQ